MLLASLLGPVRQSFGPLRGHFARCGLILLIGHGINLGLGVIALFVHGLRLNTLEFARQVGVIWSGRAFEPMAHFQLQGIEEG